MTLNIILSAALLVVIQALPVKADGDLKDPPQFTGMPSHSVIEAEDKDFDSYKFCDGKKLFTVEGKVWRKHYNLKDGAQQPSATQVTRNYANALKKLGGTVVADSQITSCGDKQYCSERVFTGKLLKDGGELLIELEPCNDGFDYWLTVVQKEAMKNDVSASALLDALKQDGHIALYINFDTGKSTIKPESTAVIDQIIAMMNSDKTIKIGIEGHTDNAGNSKSNKTLSDARAKAVMAAIVKGGIAASRLTAVGFGQEKPIADNGTNEGKQKNRRVELVKK